MANRKLVRDMTEEEHIEFKKDLQAKKDLIRSLSPRDRAIYERERQKKWSNDYLKRAYDTVNFRTPKGGKEIIKEFAAEQGMTMNDFLRKMVCQGMAQEGYSFDDTLIYPSNVAPDKNPFI